MKTIDVSDKIETLREAKAYGFIELSKETIEKIKSNQLPKGNLIEATKLCALYGAKATQQLLPFCHPISIDFVEGEVNIKENGIEVFATVRGISRTGYEMEALNAVNTMLLNIYDMCKGIDKNMVIKEIKLLSKKGGKSDYFEDLSGEKAAVIVLSDRASKGEYEDKSGKIAIEMLKKLKAEVVHYEVIPDDKDMLIYRLKSLQNTVNIIITSGSTGFSKRDIAPEATKEVIIKEMVGFEEIMRVYGYRKVPKSIMSRGVCGIINENCIVINLPGSSGGVKDNLSMIGGLIKHALKMARGEGH
ncbi:molybdenum cofactor biosynthesis protein C [Hydrogenobaculum sp. Y04AAS1]|uniref:bifunctional molybdenum cofactor biosynthesis protein MoaC/MoaB n=1 Tax=Hydrogenobaculum sp. (strain Y04AAS1) TaxID=380749 RepID=UPI00017BBD8E|nr:molybdenum cofactor biosynthesis protein C [Hydrogenobaculum sp. Y04AAS1]HCT67234.1 bifunctional molybdenum cofactor biosynthesis protein MoaC/MoaB [Hydrogenobaculum sp.]